MLRIRTKFVQPGTLSIYVSNGRVALGQAINEHDLRQTHQPTRLLKNMLDEMDLKLVELQTQKGNHD